MRLLPPRPRLVESRSCTQQVLCNKCAQVHAQRREDSWAAFHLRTAFRKIRSARERAEPAAETGCQKGVESTNLTPHTSGWPADHNKQRRWRVVILQEDTKKDSSSKTCLYSARSCTRMRATRTCCCTLFCLGTAYAPRSRPRVHVNYTAWSSGRITAN